MEAEADGVIEGRNAVIEALRAGEQIDKIYILKGETDKGVKALNVTEKNGNIVSFKSVVGDEDLIIITDSGIIIRLSIEQISTTGRVAQGVKLINLKDEQKVSTISVIEKEVEENNEEQVEE